ncbi:unnamed protein product, partial [Candidula unifasciata]
CLLKGRLLHAETVAESLRSDLNKVKKDCLELQGTKAGLQQRLKDQEGNIAGLRSKVMKLELENETLLLEIEALKKHQHEREQVFSDVKMSFIKQVEDKDKIIGDLKKELLNREGKINELQQTRCLSEPREAKKVNDIRREAISVVNSSRSRQQEDKELSSLEKRILSLTECLRWMEGSKMPSRLQ